MPEFLGQLILVALGIVFSAFYVPWVARRWQHRQRALEVKADLVSQMSRCVMTFDADLRNRARTLMQWRPRRPAPRSGVTNTTLATIAREFDVSRCVIGTELEAYFPVGKGPTDHCISCEWTRFTDLFLAFSALPVRDPGRQHPDFARQVDALPLSDAQKRTARREAARFADLDRDWSTLEQLLLAEKLRLIVAVRTTPMPRVAND